jgi:hypothetical protein
LENIMTRKTKKLGPPTVPVSELPRLLRDPTAHDLMLRFHATFGCFDVRETMDMRMTFHLDRTRLLIEDWLNLFEHPDELDEYIPGIGDTAPGPEI